MDVQLCGTFLTGNRLEKILLENSSVLNLNGHRLQNVQAHTFGDSPGFTSTIVRCTLDWTPSDTDLPQSLVIKVLGNQIMTWEKMSKQEIDKLIVQKKQIHKIECSFYDFVELRNFVTLPKCFVKSDWVGDEPGYMIMEDMCDRSHSMSLKHVGHGLNPEQLESVLDFLTSVHAWSANTNQDWKSKIPELSEIEIITNWLVQIGDALRANFPKVKENYPVEFENITVAKFSEVFNHKNFIDFLTVEPVEKYGLPMVLCHGDFHCGNMLFEKTPDGGFGNRLVSVVDWQASYRGCGLVDLARLSIMGLSTSARRELGYGLLKRYIELFNSKIQNEQYKISFEIAKRAYDKIYGFAGFMWAANIPLLNGWIAAMNNTTHEEKQDLEKRLIRYYLDSFSEAREILGI